METVRVVVGTERGTQAAGGLHADQVGGEQPFSRGVTLFGQCQRRRQHRDRRVADVAEVGGVGVEGV